jgi:integrase
VAFLLYTGARIGEALWLDWRYLDLRRGQVQFLDTKNGTDRGVPLHPALVAILADLPSRGKNSSEVFRKADGMPYAYLNAEDDRDVRPARASKRDSAAPATAPGFLIFRRTIAGTPGQPGTISKTAISTC